jgi:hypothetical protein
VGDGVACFSEGPAGGKLQARGGDQYPPGGET